MNRAKIIKALNTPVGRKLIVTALVAGAAMLGVTFSPELAEGITAIAFAVADAL